MCLICPISRQLTPGAAASGADQRHRLSQAVAVLYTGDGRRIDRSGVGPERRAAVSGASVAATAGGVRDEQGRRLGNGGTQVYPKAGVESWMVQGHDRLE